MTRRIKQLMVGLRTPPEWRYLPSGEAGETLRDACYAELLARLGEAFPDVEGAIVAGEPGVPGVPDASGAHDGVAAKIVYPNPEALVASVNVDQRTIWQAARSVQERIAARATLAIMARFAGQPDLGRLERDIRSRDPQGRMTWTEAAELAEHVARYRPCGIDPTSVHLDATPEGGYAVVAPVRVSGLEITLPVTWASPAVVAVGEPFAALPLATAGEEMLAVVG